MTKTIELKEKELEKINTMLKMTGEEIYSLYGMKCDETIKYTVDFGNGIEVDIKVVICAEEPPYVEGVFFVNGYELTHTEPSDDILGEWHFKLNNTEYIVNVVTENI